MELITNKKKYSNSLSKTIVQGFIDSLESLIPINDSKSILDVGCGEGAILHHLNRVFPNLPNDVHALDHDKTELAMAKENLPFANVVKGSIYELPFDNNSKELVICTEVLEHLQEPDKALKELCRVSSKYLLVSVPREPLWRILNMARLKYLSNFGNTPDHRNHWNSKQFRRFIETEANVLKLQKPIPWTMILASV